MPATGEPKLIFSHPFLEALQRALKVELTVTVRAKLKAAGLDFDRLEPAYPAERVAQWLVLIAELFYPGMARDEALRRLGLRVFEEWAQTLLGSAALAVMKLIGPVGSLKRMGRNFRTSDNFTEVEFAELGPRDCELRFNDVLGIPAYFLGIMQGGAKALQLDPRVTIAPVEGSPGAVVRVRWGE